MKRQRSAAERTNTGMEGIQQDMEHHDTQYANQYGTHGNLFTEETGCHIAREDYSE